MIMMITVISKFKSQNFIFLTSQFAGSQFQMVRNLDLRLVTPADESDCPARHKLSRPVFMTVTLVLLQVVEF